MFTGLITHIGMVSKIKSSILQDNFLRINIKWQYKHIYNDKWDYDLVGNPMIIRNLKTRDQKGEIDCVVALSKTGDVIMLDLVTGQPVFKNSFTNIAVSKIHFSLSMLMSSRINLTLS